MRTDHIFNLINFFGLLMISLSVSSYENVIGVLLHSKISTSPFSVILISDAWVGPMHCPVLNVVHPVFPRATPVSLAFD